MPHSGLFLEGEVHGVAGFSSNFGKTMEENRKLRHEIGSKKTFDS